MRALARIVSSRSRWTVVAVVVSAVCAVAVAAPSATATAGATGCATHTAWTTFGFDDARTGFNPCETVITPATGSNLHLLWSTPLHDFTAAQPTYAPGIVVNGVAHDLVFAVDEHGYVEAVDVATGKVMWRRPTGSQKTKCADMPDMKFGASGAPALDLSTNTGYIVNGKDRLYALDLSTGRKKTGWKALSIGSSLLDHVYGAVTLRNGIAYITTASYCDMGQYYGRVVAVNVATETIVSTWKVVDPTLNPGGYGGGIWGPGGVSIDEANGAVYAATGNSLPGEHAGYAEQVVRLDQNLVPQAGNYVPLVGTDADYGATPLLFQPPACPAMVAAENKSGVLVVYDRDSIASGPVQQLQIASSDDSEFMGMPAYSPATNTVYIANSSDSNTDVYTHGMVALKVQPDCTLALAWQTVAGPNFTVISPPTVAGGVVYWGDGPGAHVWALDATTGAYVWDSNNAISGGVWAAPMVADGHLFVAGADGRLYCFGT